MDSSRRGALLEAMLAELTRDGYRGLRAERALVRAGVSEEQFEAEFADLDQCLIAAYEELCTRVVAKASERCEEAAPWPERVRVGLAAVLAAIASQPETAQMMTRGFPGVRPSFYVHYVDFLALFSPFMREGRELSGVEAELPKEVELLAVGAAESTIFAELEAGRAERLPWLLPEILFSVLVPFLGPERAADEMKIASAALK